jgi:hypothetical protein
MSSKELCGIVTTLDEDALCGPECVADATEAAKMVAVDTKVDIAMLVSTLFADANDTFTVRVFEFAF